MLLDGEAIGYGQIYRLYGELYDEYHYPDFGDVVYAMDQFIGDPELWDIGIGTRYVRLVVGWLAQKRKADAVLVDPRTANLRAVRCYQKAGFEVVRLLPAHELHEGELRDCWLMRRTLA
jgi:RimJ/RimL family protein N-acetyltransferase